MNASLTLPMAAKTILLITTEPNVREILHLSLMEFGGWQVFSTGSSLEGLQRAAEDQPDAIVLALSSSDTNYSTFLQNLRAQPKSQTIPVVILMAGAKWLDSKRLQQFQVVGAIDYAANPSLLSNQIAKLLDWEANPLFGDENR